MPSHDALGRHRRPVAVSPPWSPRHDLYLQPPLGIPARRYLPPELGPDAVGVLDRDEANRIAMAMLEASRYFEHRLPEAFSGYARQPVLYPTACNPQAWASGAPLLFLRTMLGLQPRDGVLHANAHIPAELGRIRVDNVSALGRRWNVEASGDRASVRSTD